MELMGFTTLYSEILPYHRVLTLVEHGNHFGGNTMLDVTI
jgi:hypothetical protein